MVKFFLVTRLTVNMAAPVKAGILSIFVVFLLVFHVDSENKIPEYVVREFKFFVERYKKPYPQGSNEYRTRLKIFWVSVVC